jgi:hypothetical protein
VDLVAQGIDGIIGGIYVVIIHSFYAKKRLKIVENIL